MAEIDYYPNPNQAQHATYEGYPFTDPGDVSEQSKYFYDAKYLPYPIGNELRYLVAEYLRSGGSWRCRNTTGSQLNKGTLCYINGLTNAVESGDAAAQLSSWVVHGVTMLNSLNGRLFWTLTDSGGTRTVTLYNRSTLLTADKVASGSSVGDGSITLTQENSSGITGSVTVAYTVDDSDTANTLDCNVLLLAKADSSDPAKQAVGVLTADLANNTNGLLYGRATVTGLNTSAVSADGVKVYLDQSTTGTAGGFVEAKPSLSGDYYDQEVGTVEIDHATEGSVHFYPTARLLSNLSSSMLGGPTIAGIGAIPKWIKITVTHTQLQTAGLTNNITLATLPAGGVLHGFKVKHSTAFAGTGITAYTLSLGIASDLAKYTVAFDVFQAVADAARQLTPYFDDESHTGTTAIKIAATSVGANLDQSSAGSVDVWLLVSKAT